MLTLTLLFFYSHYVYRAKLSLVKTNVGNFDVSKNKSIFMSIIIVHSRVQIDLWVTLLQVGKLQKVFDSLTTSVFIPEVNSE